MPIQRIQFRRGAAADWTTVNPVLASGEPGFEQDTGLFKLGNAVDAWNDLDYAGGGGGGGGGPVTASDITDSTVVGRALITAANAAAARGAIVAAAAAHTHLIGDISNASALGAQLLAIGSPAAARVALDAAQASHTHTATQISNASTLGQALITAVNPAAALAALGLDDASQTTKILTTVRNNGYRRVFQSDDPEFIPVGAETGDIVGVTADGGGGLFSYINLATSVPTSAAGTTVSSGTLADDGGDEDVWAYVWSANTAGTAGTITSPVGSTNPAWNADSLAGGGRVWTKVANTESSLTNGQGGGGWWRGTASGGSATTGPVTATWTSTAHGSAGAAAKDARGIQVVQITGVDSGIIQAATSGPITSTTPSASLSSVVSSDPVLSAIMFNGETQLAELATGSAWTQDTAHRQLAGGAASLQVVLAYSLTGLNSVQFTTATNANWKAVSIVELSP